MSAGYRKKVSPFHFYPFLISVHLFCWCWQQKTTQEIDSHNWSAEKCRFHEVRLSFVIMIRYLSLRPCVESQFDIAMNHHLSLRDRKDREPEHSIIVIIRVSLPLDPKTSCCRSEQFDSGKDRVRFMIWWFVRLSTDSLCLHVCNMVKRSSKKSIQRSLQRERKKGCVSLMKDKRVSSS